MTTEPDPQLVREIAREHILDCGQNADDIGSYVMLRVGSDLSKHEYGAWCSAVRQAIATAQIMVSWPDEQAQAERDACANCGRDFSLPYVTRQTGTDRCEDCTATCGFPGCGHPDHQRAEQAQAERDGDVRPVAEVLVALDVMVTQPPAGLGRRIEKLRVRFADRIAALAELDAKAGNER